MKAWKVLFGGLLLMCGPDMVQSQTLSDTLSQPASLSECVAYALNHQPYVRQAQLDERIAERTIQSRLADWFPQVNLNYNFQHFLKLPVIILPDFANPTSGVRREVQTGVANTSTAAFSATQSIFNRDLLQAGQTAQAVRAQANLNTKRTKIDVTVDVSKAYYEVLLTQQQADIIESDIVRLERSLRDAYNQFQGGIVDKTDYKRATIALNNSKAQLKRAQEQLDARYASLKNLMGYPVQGTLVVLNDSTNLEAEAMLDTNLILHPESRVEYQLLQTQRSLQEADVLYNRRSYLPTVSAFLNYNLIHQNQEFSELFNRSFPNSLYGLTLTYPIFQGGKRLHNIKAAQLRLDRLDWEFVALRNAIGAEYAQALADYKSNLNDYLMLRENRELAQEVYDVINLQYKSGVKTYLEVIIAQADLQAAEFNYINALYRLLSSRYDVERALGFINPY
ncbi:TolC family protein [Rhabdobacter roseus]|uniref:Outer membrane protein TolC n=1 Tax=Rhabdobacter roseus TaxID=1655419 RepID=A0A840TZE7_9BACT|nr:TolC family protein [Rhabdobacter roseus]MBB5286907.1 outer membrane protein TolC [Rhabdobacter roseus]